MRPSSSAFSEADPHASHPDPAATPARVRYRPLRQVIGAMDLDILVELDRFRHWHQTQTQMASVVSAADPPPGRSAWSHLQPQEVVEDLEAEIDPQRGNFLSSVLVLLLWLLSCSGIGLGLWWLISPGEPDRLLASFARPSPPPLPPLPDLEALPLIRPADLDLATQTQQELARDPSAPTAEIPTQQPSPALDLEGVEVRQLQQPTWLDLLQQERSQFGTASSAIPTTVERAEVASARLPTATPQITPTPTADPTPVRTPVPDPTPIPTATPSPIAQPEPPQPTATAQATASTGSRSPASSALGPQGGAGTYLVVIRYQGEASLAQARQVSAGAFVKTIDGQEFVQLAAFQQVEHARYMAEDLRRQGFAVQVTGG